jgi:16S rRNA (guanine527-N7)-methyltransferase
MEPAGLLEQGLVFFRVPFDGPIIRDLCLYVTELEKWNRRMNLVGFRDTPSIVQKLLYDAMLLHGYVKDGPSVLDMGSGAGVLGIPLAILNKETQVFSVDKSLRKIQFQNHIRRTLGLHRFLPLHGRIESLEPLEVESLVVKAFGGITDILGKGGRHIRKAGRAFILKGPREKAVEHEGFTMTDEAPYVLPSGANPYRLLIYRKD